jgi:hypothetical protein
MGNSSISIEGNTMDAALNPAVLYGAKIHSVSISATPARFGLTELSSYEVCYNRNLSILNAGIRASLFGFELYKEMLFGITLSNDFLNNFHAGININYHEITIKNYGTSGTASLDAGLNYNIRKRFSIGFSFINLNSADIGGDKLDQETNVGLSYQALDNFLISFRIEKNILYDANYNAGLEYKIAPELAIRLGINSEPEIFFGGVGFKHSSLTFDYAYSFHNILGNTHSFSISMNFEE